MPLKIVDDPEGRVGAVAIALNSLQGIYVLTVMQPELCVMANRQRTLPPPLKLHQNYCNQRYWLPPRTY